MKNIIFGCISFAGFAILLHAYILFLNMSSVHLMAWEEKARIYYRYKVYFVCVILSWLTVVYKGASVLLYWIPSDLITYTDDGDPIKIKDMIAVVISLFSIKIVFCIQEAIHAKPDLSEQNNTY